LAAGPFVAKLPNDYIMGQDGKRNTCPVAGVFYGRNGKIVRMD
jgi:hypothetical protein